jgi:hypothetical protein
MSDNGLCGNGCKHGALGLKIGEPAERKESVVEARAEKEHESKMGSRKKTRSL